MSSPSGFAGYKAAMNAVSDAESRVAAIGLDALKANADKLGVELRKDLLDNLQYPWDDQHVLIKEPASFWNHWQARLVVMPMGAIPSPGVVPVPVPIKPAAPASRMSGLSIVLMLACTAVATWFFASGTYEHVSWPKIPDPFYHSAAEKAGKAASKDILAGIADSLHLMARDIRNGISPDAAKLAHKSRLPEAIKLKSGAPIAAILDAIIPPSTDGTTSLITVPQATAYSTAIDEFADGISPTKPK